MVGPELPPPPSSAELVSLKKVRTKLTEECNRLKADINAMDTDLSQIEKLIKADPKVKRARKNYKKNRERFTQSMFSSLQYGKLDDVALMVAALDIEGVGITSVTESKFGYSLIHLALLTDKQDIVEFLLEHSGRAMAIKTIETDECKNLTPLYIAIQHGRAKHVELLLNALKEEDRAEYINQKVDNKAYADTFYNELPLAAAVWSSAGNHDLSEICKMLTCLVENGAQLDMTTEARGNTLLHLLVMQSVESFEHIDYFRKFLRGPFTHAAGIWWNNRYTKKYPSRKKKPQKHAQIRGLKDLFDIRNKKGYTPLSLAAKVESPLYMDFVNWESVMRFPDLKLGQQFSNLDLYNITDITSLKRAESGWLSYNDGSIMHVLAHNNVDIAQTVCDTDISTIEPLKSIIEKKWHVYQAIFYFWGFIHIVYMSVFMQVAFRYNPNNTETEDTQSDAHNGTGIRTAALASGYYGPVAKANPAFIVFAILPVWYLIWEVIDVSSLGCGKVKPNFSLTGNGVYRVISLLFSVFTLVWILLHMIRNVNQDIVLSIALLFGWIFGIFFTRTIDFPNKSSQIGAFSIMVQRMLFHDLFPFLVISMFVLLAFTAAIHATFLHSEETIKNRWLFRNTFFDMLKYYSALDDGQDHTSSREKEFAKAVLSVYGIISVVLLINMLIAAMNKTYELVRDTHTDLVVRQRLAILLMLERRVPFQCVRRLSEQAFSEEGKQRYLQVISKKEMTALIRKRRRAQKDD